MKATVTTPEQRMSAPLKGNIEERNIHLPIPFGWYVMAYSDELAAGEVKPGGSDQIEQARTSVLALLENQDEVIGRLKASIAG